MRTIIRCPACFTYVYSDARRCHGCGQRVGTRKILTRGSWIFIVLAVAGYTFARGIDLHQDQRQRIRRQAEAGQEIALTKAFLRSWLSEPSRDFTGITETDVFRNDLARLREKFPEVLPATSVESVRVSEAGFQQYHSQEWTGPVIHEIGRGDPKLLASVGNPRSGSRLTRFTRRNWYSYAYQFTADFLTNDRSYSVIGQVCFEDGRISCLALHRIESVEGVVNPKE